MKTKIKIASSQHFICRHQVSMVISPIHQRKKLAHSSGRKKILVPKFAWKSQHLKYEKMERILFRHVEIWFGSGSNGSGHEQIYLFSPEGIYPFLITWDQDAGLDMPRWRAASSISSRIRGWFALGSEDLWFPEGQISDEKSHNFSSDFRENGKFFVFVLR